MVDIITIGSATVDYFGSFDSKFRKVKSGDKVLLTDLEIHTGGGGTNSAVALSRLGFKVAYLGKFGDDGNEKIIIEELKKERVKIINTKKCDGKNSISFILCSKKEKDRIIYAHKGSSDKLDKNDFTLNDIKCKYLYMGTMLNKGWDSCKKISKYAKKKDIKILFNPSSYLAKKGKDFLEPILKNTEILICNISEAMSILKTKKNKPEDILKKLKSLGPKIVVITNGPKKIYAIDNEFIYETTPKKVKVINVTGAGDAFSSAFFAGYIKNESIETCLSWGIENSNSVIQYLGTKNNLLTKLNSKMKVKKNAYIN